MKRKDFNVSLKSDEWLSSYSTLKFQKLRKFFEKLQNLNYDF